MESNKKNFWVTVFKVISYMASAIAGAIGQYVLS